MDKYLTLGLVGLMLAVPQTGGASVPEMVKIPAGGFSMGSLPDENGREGDEAPRHTVAISHDFYVSKFEVTEHDWADCVAARACPPLRKSYGDTFPATDIRWKEAKAYVAWLSGVTGQPYRLLTEAEWEYVARAGSSMAFSTGDAISPKDANYAASGLGRPREVGRYPPNDFGLYDMHGNVWEWVEDCYSEGGYYKASPEGVANNQPECQMHVLRGGAFDTRPEQLRVSYRFRAQFAGADVGFRVARGAD